MDERLIEEIKQIEDRDKVIELLQEAKDAINSELSVVYDKIKEVNKELAISILEEQILANNCLLSVVTEHLVEKYKLGNVHIDQLQFINSLCLGSEVDINLEKVKV